MCVKKIGVGKSKRWQARAVEADILSTSKNIFQTPKEQISKAIEKERGEQRKMGSGRGA